MSAARPRRIRTASKRTFQRAIDESLQATQPQFEEALERTRDGRLVDRIADLLVADFKRRQASDASATDPARR